MRTRMVDVCVVCRGVVVVACGNRAATLLAAHVAYFYGFSGYCRHVRVFH